MTDHKQIGKLPMISFARFMHAAPLLLTAALLLLAPPTIPAFQQPSLSIGSGNSTGAYYAVSSAIAKIFNRRSADYGMRLATTASQGSVDNIDSVAEGKDAFGIAQANLLRDAAQGLGPWQSKARTGLRAVLGLPVQAVTIVAAVNSGISRVTDLKGKRINIGAPGSSDYDYTANLLQLSGVNPAEVTFSGHAAALAPELLQKGKIDAYIYTVCHPNLSVLEASSGKRKVLLIPLDKALIEHLTSRDPLLLPAVVTTDFYPGVENQGPAPTIGVRAVLFTRADMAEETVYRLVREIMTSFELFRRQHPVLQDLTPREAAGVTVIPLHPGAERYFKEAGLSP